MRFGKKGKLSPRYIGPYKILRRMEKVAYELDLPKRVGNGSSCFPCFYVEKVYW